MNRFRKARQREIPYREPPAFTIIELLVVIAVIALLITLVTAAGGQLLEQQRRRNTQQVMQSLTLAVEQFAQDNPLHNFYNRKDTVSFGPYPPYQLKKGRNPTLQSVSRLFEWNPPLPGGHTSSSNMLSNRLARDMNCRTDLGETIQDYVSIYNESTGSPDDANYQGDALTDARALFVYLKLFSPQALNLIPEEYLKPAYPNRPREQQDYVNKRGTGTNPNDATVRETLDNILVVHDAWGVPLDYMLYVKAECRMAVRRPGFIPMDEELRFVATERRPVFRSLGIKREVYDEAIRVQPDFPAQRRYDASKWVFSEELPQPYAGLLGNDYDYFPDPPSLGTNISSVNGWLRMAAVGEDYGYLPTADDR